MAKIGVDFGLVWVGGDRRSWWHGFGVEIGGSLGYLMVVLLGLGDVCGFVSGSVEGFNGDFFKIGLLGLLGFGLV